MVLALSRTAASVGVPYRVLLWCDVELRLQKSESTFDVLGHHRAEGWAAAFGAHTSHHAAMAHQRLALAAGLLILHGAAIRLASLLCLALSVRAIASSAATVSVKFLIAFMASLPIPIDHTPRNA